MRTGVVVSIVAHLALLAWALYSVAATRTLEPVEEVPINVDLVSIADVPNIRQGDKKAKTEATKGEKDKTKQTANPTKAKNERVAVVAPTKKEEVKAKDPEKKEEVKVEEPKKEEPKKEEPKPEPEKVEVKKEEPKKEEPKKIETAMVPEKKKEEPKKEEPKKVAVKDEPKKEKKVAKAEKQLDIDSIEKLLQDKQPDAAAQASTTKVAEKPKEKPKLQIGAENGSGDALTISEKQALIAALRQQISRCWSPPGGQSGAEMLTVRLNIELDQQGNLKGMPRTLNRESSPLFLIAEESAVRAVYDCQPYNLPTEHYTSWRSVNFKFDPSEMMGSGF